MRALNLGCGSRYHREWTNVDFISTGEGVIAHNLLDGVPFEENSFDVVYHSHVLEHIPKLYANNFIAECSRVLRPGGVLRVAVPDLEAIAKEYLTCLNQASEGDGAAAYNYDWMMLELYDQVTREQSGGEMLGFLCQRDLVNQDFVYSRIGEEGRSIRERFREQADRPGIKAVSKSSLETAEKYFKWRNYKSLIKRWLKDPEEDHHTEIGRFRRSGEVHLWMYDRFSLSRLLVQNGFSEVKLAGPFTSRIPGWSKFNLDGADGRAFKPDSLYMEAMKS